MGQSSSNPSIPKDYKELERLRAGRFGVVVKCERKDTKEIVALKIPQRGNLDSELALMTFFKRNELDKWNIVRFIGPVALTNNCTALAFESPGMTLRQHMKATHSIRVGDMRGLVRQVASALRALESIKVIHADITLDSIMVVDREVKPLRMKLFDFGSAFPSSLAKPGFFHQMTVYRAPEIFLGLQFSESIDMWSLGIVFSTIVLRRFIFPGINDYNIVRHIVDFLGVPPDHLLDAGMFSNKYFVRNRFGQWRRKTYEEFWSPRKVPDNARVKRINYPSTLEMSAVNLAVPGGEECIDLLNAMLRMDSTKRITPSQVLAHPFVTGGNLQPGSDSIGEATGQPPQTLYSTSMEYRNWVGRDSECHEPAAAEIPPGVILVQPAPPECCLALVEEDSSQGETSRVGRDSECHEPAAAEIPPGVILVQPAPPECCLAVEDNSQGETSRLGYDSECHEPAAAEIPPGVILVQPAPPECCLALVEENRQGETSRSISEASAPRPWWSTSMECKSWVGSDSECHEPAAAEIPPGAMLVQPATPERRLAWADDNRQGETSCPPDLLEELSKNSSTDLLLHSSEDTASEPKKRKKMKKRNPFKRLWAWAKDTFSSSSVDAER